MEDTVIRRSKGSETHKQAIRETGQINVFLGLFGLKRMSTIFFEPFKPCFAVVL